MASLDIWFGGCLYGLSRVQLLNRAHVTRGKMSASSASLRYVLLPPEKAPRVKAAWPQLVGIGASGWYLRNRERELGLDRRETG